jgi:putative chitinase
VVSLKSLFDLLARLFSKRSASESSSPVAAAFPIDTATMERALIAAAAPQKPLDVVGETARFIAAAVEFGVTETRVIARMLSELGHESGGFRFTEEVWADSPAQLRYEFNKRLGNDQPGDGKKHKGIFRIQLTGKWNHTEAAKYFGISIEELHARVNDLSFGMRVSFWYITKLRPGFITAARANDHLAASVAVNGANRNTGLPNGWEDRQRRFWNVCKALGIDP